MEIRWHGRGGQGAKTASLGLLAQAAFNAGMYIQGFPEYGQNRMGTYSQLNERLPEFPSTRVHSNLWADYVVVSR